MEKYNEERRYKIVILGSSTIIKGADDFIEQYKDYLPRDVEVVYVDDRYYRPGLGVKIWSAEFDIIPTDVALPEHPVPQYPSNKVAPINTGKAMLNITDEQINSIRNQLGSANIKAVGYRLMVKPIKASKEMESAEAVKFKALAAKGFEVKSKDQESRETKGSDVGVIVHAGPDCYESGVLKERKPWAKQGDVVIFPRYAGHSCELPPGSGDYYQFMTDDDLVGKYEGIEL